MKKLISMLLVLCMVVTTLMGVMVADVNAASTADFEKTVVVTPATDTTIRKIEYRYGLAGLPAVGSTDRCRNLQVNLPQVNGGQLVISITACSMRII